MQYIHKLNVIIKYLNIKKFSCRQFNFDTFFKWNFCGIAYTFAGNTFHALHGILNTSYAYILII